MTPELQDAIRRRAQQLYEQRGCTPGHEVQDWLQAEAEILKQSNPDPAYVKIRLNGVTYTGEYDRNHSDGYTPGEFRPGSPIEIRVASDKMFVKRPNGKELETRIIRKEASIEIRPWP
ncbi:MAG TPA: DUF2934 domain-containing protein [Terriglobales bacterium]|nr:DUF2934 domain-containing protein [Terriglobales bacterium]